MADNAYIVREDGELYTIPSGDLVAELRTGSRVASQAEIDAQVRKQAMDAAYSSLPQRALGEVEEFADSLTLGASRWLQKGMGFDPEAIREREARASPIATTLGIVGPALVTGGGSAVAQGALKAGGKALVKEGAEVLVKEGVEEVAKKGLLSTVAGATPAGLAVGLERSVAGALAPAGSGLARRAFATASGSAVGGALVGAGDVLSEEAIGNPAANGEDFFSRFGQGALEGAVFGFGVGGAFELGAGTLSAAARGARKATDKLVEAAVSRYGTHAKQMFPQYADAIDDIAANRAALTTRGNEVVREALEKQARGEIDDAVLRDVPDEFVPAKVPDEFEYRKAPRPKKTAPLVEEPDVAAMAEGATKQIKAIDDMTVALNAATDDGIDSIRQMERKALSEQIAATPEAIAKINDVGTEAYNRGSKLLAAMNNEPALYNSTTRSGLADALDAAAAAGLGGRPNMTPLAVFEAIDDLRKGINNRDLAQFGKTVSRKNQKVVAEIKHYLRDLKTTLGREDLFSQMAARDILVKKASNTYLSARKAPKTKGGRGYVDDFFDTRTTEGSREYVAKPEAFRKLLEGDPVLTETFARFQRSLPDYIEQAELSAVHAPGRFDRALLDEGIAKVRANYEEGVSRVTRRDMAKKADADALDSFREAERVRANTARDAKKAFRDEQKALKAENTAARSEAQGANKAAEKAVKTERAGFVKTAASELAGPQSFSVWDVAGFGAGMLHPALFWPYVLMKLKGFLGSPAKVYRVLAGLEKAVQETSNTMASAARALSAPTRMAADAGRLAFAGTGSYAKQAEGERRTFDKRVKSLQTIAERPAKLVDDLEGLTSGVAEVAPLSAEAAQATAVRAVQYMLGRLPPEPDLGPFGGEWLQPANVVADFNRSWDGAFGGAAAIAERIKTGDLMPSDVEVFKAVYPEQHADLSGRLVLAAATKKDLTPRAQKLLETFFGAPVSEIQSAKFTAGMQLVYEAAGEGQGIQPSHKDRTVDLSASERVATAFSAEGPVGEREA